MWLVQSRLFPWLLLFVALAMLVAVDIPLCGFKAVFGVPCPGCGMTRALSALLIGDLSAAFRYHPLVYVLGPAVAAFAFVDIALRKPLRPTWIVTAVLTFGVVSISLWVARLGGALGGHPDLAAPLF